MVITAIFVLCSLAGLDTAHSEVVLMADIPYVSIPLSHTAVVKCCYTTTTMSVEKAKSTRTWIKTSKVDNNISSVPAVNVHNSVISGDENLAETQCGTLTFGSVRLNDTGLYQCWFNNSHIFSHGTYLLVYKPLEKSITLSESTKNKILTAEGILLLLCMLLPSATLLCKTKKLHQLEKKKAIKEEENIYQGLNLDECSSTYDQIERPHAQGQYQDVYIKDMEEEEEIQLEKP